MNRVVNNIIFILSFFCFQSIANSTDSGLGSDEFWQQEQQRINKEQNVDYRNYKIEQEKLPDAKRSKSIPYNEYWLINKGQDFWIGIFDGKYVNSSLSYDNGNNKGYRPQQVIRMRRRDKLSQFLIQEEGGKHPLLCLNWDGAIISDTPRYTYFYAGCTDYKLQIKSIKHEGVYYILFYDKKFDTLIELSSLPYSIPDGLKYQAQSFLFRNGYYIYQLGAFKVTGKDQIIIVDPNTGDVLPKVPKTDDNGKAIFFDGKPIMVDDPDGYNPVILKRLPEATVTN